MTAPQYLLTSWIDPRIEARTSQIHAVGLFASGDIHAGSVVIVYGGRVVGNDYISSLPSWSCIALSETQSLLQPEGDPARFVNHGCDSNLWMADATTAVAKRLIAGDEEITLDYALVSAGGDWQMECRCGSANCRGLVTAEDWQRPEVQQRYAGHFSPFINHRIASTH
jgi:hypothetical protein